MAELSDNAIQDAAKERKSTRRRNDTPMQVTHSPELTPEMTLAMTRMVVPQLGALLRKLRMERALASENGTLPTTNTALLAEAGTLGGDEEVIQ